MKKRRSFIIILLILILVGYIWYWNSKTESPEGVTLPNADPAPLQQAEPKKENTNSSQEVRPSPAQGQMELSPEIKQSYDRSASGEEFNETMKRQDKGIAITPGVTFELGKGINLKKPGAEESIQIKRDNTYRSDEYKVQWEKKF